MPVALVVVAGLLLLLSRRLREPGRRTPSTLLLVTGLLIAPAVVVAGAWNGMVSDMKQVEAIRLPGRGRGNRDDPGSPGARP